MHPMLAKIVGASFLLCAVGVLLINMLTFTVAMAEEGSTTRLTLLHVKALQQNGTIKPGPKQDRPWLPGTGVLTPRGAGEVGTKGVEQQRRRLSQPLMYKERTSDQCGDSGHTVGTRSSRSD